MAGMAVLVGIAAPGTRQGQGTDAEEEGGEARTCVRV